MRQRPSAPRRAASRSAIWCAATLVTLMQILHPTADARAQTAPQPPGNQHGQTQTAGPAEMSAPTAQQPSALVLTGFGQTLFDQRCSNCHTLTPGERSLAPPLLGLIGRRAGSAEGYHYSVKLAGSDLVWDRQTLNEWLEKSTIATPDIRFRHVGVRDAIERLALVDYIATAGNTDAAADKPSK